MSSISQVSSEMETILSQRAKALERATGFVQRSTAQLDGPIFAQTTVLTWMHHPQAGYAHLRITAASLGVSVSKQAIEQRFSASSARLLQALFEEAVAAVISSEGTLPQVLSRFHGVYLQDGTIISLPQPLAQQWPAGAGTGKGAALRVQARLEVGHGQLAGVWLQAGQAAERSGPAIQTPLPAGSLFNADMGYFTLPQMRQRGQQGQYWLTQAKATLCITDAQGRSCDLLTFLQQQERDEVDVWVQVGKRDRLPARLIAVRVSAQTAQGRRQRANQRITLPPKGSQAHVPGKRKSKEQRQGKRKAKPVSAARLRLADWTILLTDVPKERLSVAEALVLARCRWQIELLWKLWKHQGKLDTWGSYKPERILTEIYAKLLGLLITHWLTLLGCWQAPNRSLHQAKQAVEWMTPCLALGFTGLLPLECVVAHSVQTLRGSRIDTRRGKPNTCQLLAQPELNSS